MQLVIERAGQHFHPGSRLFIERPVSGIESRQILQQRLNPAIENFLCRSIFGSQPVIEYSPERPHESIQNMRGRITRYSSIQRLLSPSSNRTPPSAIGRVKRDKRFFCSDADTYRLSRLSLDHAHALAREAKHPVPAPVRNTMAPLACHDTPNQNDGSRPKAHEHSAPGSPSSQSAAFSVFLPSSVSPVSQKRL